MITKEKQLEIQSSEILSFDGIIKLSKMKKEERPIDWENLVRHYLDIKEKICNNLEEHVEKSKRQYWEAHNIAKKLGVIKERPIDWV